jgi:hypothetical protein
MLPMAEWALVLINNTSRSPVAASINLAWHPTTRHVPNEKATREAERRATRDIYLLQMEGKVGLTNVRG